MEEEVDRLGVSKGNISLLYGPGVPTLYGRAVQEGGVHNSVPQRGMTAVHYVVAEGRVSVLSWARVGVGLFDRLRQSSTGRQLLLGLTTRSERCRRRTLAGAVAPVQRLRTLMSTAGTQEDMSVGAQPEQHTLSAPIQAQTTPEQGVAMLAQPDTEHAGEQADVLKRSLAV